jgi:hypothetical protein
MPQTLLPVSLKNFYFIHLNPTPQFAGCKKLACGFSCDAAHCHGSRYR